jgi:excisionase family DNA binding protein
MDKTQKTQTAMAAETNQAGEAQQITQAVLAGHSIQPAQIGPHFTDQTEGNYLGVPARTIREWRMRRALPFSKGSGKFVQIKRDDLDKWIDKHRVVMGKAA